jgi:simple sugar transport system substrate-binding protein
VLCARQEQTNIGLEERCKGLSTTFKGTVKSEFVGLDTDPAGQEAQIAAAAGQPRHRRHPGTGPIVAKSAIGASADGRSPAMSVASTSRRTSTAIKSGDLAFTVDQPWYLQGTCRSADVPAGRT